jgi:hypothetical protein
VAYDFNYDLFALTPDKFRSRWAPSLKDFNDEEILRMRAAATPPRRIVVSALLSSGETSVDFSTWSSTSVVVAMRFFTRGFDLAADSRQVLLKRTAEDVDSISVPIYGYDNITVEDFLPLVEATLSNDEVIVVHVLGYTPE